MEISQERIDELKKIMEKDGKKYTDEEARDAAYNLMGFAEICYNFCKFGLFISWNLVPYSFIWRPRPDSNR